MENFVNLSGIKSFLFRIKIFVAYVDPIDFRRSTPFPVMLDFSTA
jgi:hypothetical protein